MDAITTMPIATGRPDLDRGLGNIGLYGFLSVLVAGLCFVAYSVYADAAASHIQAASYLPFGLLFLALLIALGFEFVNGFHDTANAVATVIYTNSLPAPVAVVWSGFWNFLGVMASTGAVAFGIVSLLPVELILQVGSDAGFAMVFSLLIAAIIWNLATWYMGIPNSSSHTLIGSIIGVGIANAILHGRSGTAGVDWTQAGKIGQALLFSPLIGFGGALVLFLATKALVRVKSLYQEPVDGKAPPPLIRGLLVLTCTGVSFAHGSNDGQKGMGLIMLILIGTLPTAYALNRAVPAGYEAQFHSQSVVAAQVIGAHAGTVPFTGDDRGAVTHYIAEKKFTPDTLPALETLVKRIDGEVGAYRTLAAVPSLQSRNIRNDMYVAGAALKQLGKDKAVTFTPAETKSLDGYSKILTKATQFIPTWVKVAVAIALGLGTMIGWKRIVVTVGEKIGKQHLTYAQGAVAELVAMATIMGADTFGLPASTTHVLTSGVAGTMAGNGSGLQWATVRDLVMAWVLTLPASILLSGGLYFALSAVI